MSAISALQGGTKTGAAAAGGAFGDLKSEDFLKVMLSELKNQDPFQPQDSSKLLEQLSSLRNIESQMSLQDSLTNLVLQNQVSSAGGLLGRLVGGLDDRNRAVQGLVTSVRVQDGKAILELDTGHALAMERVTQIGGNE